MCCISSSMPTTCSARLLFLRLEILLKPNKSWHAINPRSQGAEVQSLPYGDKEVTSVRFSPNGELLATAGQDRKIRLWTVGSWKEWKKLEKHERTVTGVAWSSDSQRLASSGRDNLVHIWDCATGNSRRRCRNIRTWSAASVGRPTAIGSLLRISTAAFWSGKHPTGHSMESCHFGISSAVQKGCSASLFHTTANWSHTGAIERRSVSLRPPA
jgi:WD40 repeat protein